MNKYVLFIPQEGFNDCLTTTEIALYYCKKYKRILLLDMSNSLYKINFSDYFDIIDPHLIYDSKKIKRIINNNKLSIFPNSIKHSHLKDILDHKVIFKYDPNNVGYKINNSVNLSLPKHNVKADIILHSRCGGGPGYSF